MLINGGVVGGFVLIGVGWIRHGLRLHKEVEGNRVNNPICRDFSLSNLTFLLVVSFQMLWIFRFWLMKEWAVRHGLLVYDGNWKRREFRVCTQVRLLPSKLGKGFKFWKILIDIIIFNHLDIYFIFLENPTYYFSMLQKKNYYVIFVYNKIILFFDHV